MPYPPPESVSREEFKKILAQLRLLLMNLPSQLPRRDGFNSAYSTFLNFGLDPDILEKTGDEVATLDEQLEHVFGWKARTTGDSIISIVERGYAICALVPIFEKYFEKYPNNNVLKKWVIDIASELRRLSSYIRFRYALQLFYLLYTLMSYHVDSHN
jgi:hypothetical protein